MPMMAVLYLVGDVLADSMEAAGVGREDVTAWHGYWVSVCTKVATSPLSELGSIAENLCACIRQARYQELAALGLEEGEINGR